MLVIEQKTNIRLSSPWFKQCDLVKLHFFLNSEALYTVLYLLLVVTACLLTAQCNVSCQLLHLCTQEAVNIYTHVWKTKTPSLSYHQSSMGAFWKCSCSLELQKPWLYTFERGLKFGKTSYGWGSCTVCLQKQKLTF